MLQFGTGLKRSLFALSEEVGLLYARTRVRVRARECARTLDARVESCCAARPVVVAAAAAAAATSVAVLLPEVKACIMLLGAPVRPLAGYFSLH